MSTPPRAEAVVKAHGSQHLRAVAAGRRRRQGARKPFRVHKPHAVISSLPYYCNPAVAKAARKGNAHYFDLTEDVEVTRAVRRIARGATRAFVPQCGLAPGFISIAANELTKHFDELRSHQAARRRAAAAP